MTASGSSKRTAQGALPAVLGSALKTFLTYMEKERGLTANTLDAYSRDLQRYLQRLAEWEVVNLEQIVADINPAS